MKEQTDIAQAARDVLQAGSRVLLFGTHTDDHHRGGDIDLLVEPPEPVKTQQAVALSTPQAAHLYRLMGERHIDILVAPADKPDN